MEDVDYAAERASVGNERGDRCGVRAISDREDQVVRSSEKVKCGNKGDVSAPPFLIALFS